MKLIKGIAFLSLLLLAPAAFGADFTILVGHYKIGQPVAHRKPGAPTPGSATGFDAGTAFTWRTSLDAIVFSDATLVAPHVTGVRAATGVLITLTSTTGNTSHSVTKTVDVVMPPTPAAPPTPAPTPTDWVNDIDFTLVD